MKTISVTDKRIDIYIDKSEAFAKPILQHLRKVIHQGCPEAVETVKWSFPHFEYKGSILCSMAAFKQHCAFGFWLAAQMKDIDGILNTNEKTAMGNLGQLKSISDLPSDKTILAYIKQAMVLIDSGAKLKKKPAVSTPITTPDYFAAALAKNKKANANFDAFPLSHKKEYIMWITEAKTEATREKRIATAIEWIAEGKGRNWKYERPQIK